MKNEHEKEVDRLIQEYKGKHPLIIRNSKGNPVSPFKSGFLSNKVQDFQSLKCALNDVENTIKVLESFPDYDFITDELDFQTKVRDILKNKLK